jgi:hypothetical protein
MNLSKRNVDNELLSGVLTKDNISNEIIYKIKNWYTSKHYYIKLFNSNNYLTINYEDDELYLTSNENEKTAFEIEFKNNNIIEIKLGIYNLTRYNCIGKIRNETILIKYLRDVRERELLLDETKNNSFYLKFIKYNSYLDINNNKIEILQNKEKNIHTRWSFEHVDYNNEYFYCTRFIKNKKIYYKDIVTNKIYTNYYKGWGLENLLW